MSRTRSGRINMAGKIIIRAKEAAAGAPALPDVRPMVW